MKALIVSDSHGLTEELTQLKKMYEGKVDVMIHCGDSELSFQQPELSGFVVVKGNCDFGASFPNEVVEEVKHIRFFATHGHLYNIKMTLQNVLYKAKEVGAHIACFGHSHILGAEVVDGVLLINPGSIALPRSRKEKTYVLLEVTGTEAKVTFLDLQGNVVIERIFTIG
ncbi:metallophosphoesterase [Microbacteriaceae bacterium 4G12]